MVTSGLDGWSPPRNPATGAPGFGGAWEIRGTELGLQIYLPLQFSTVRIGQKFFPILFLPKDMDEMEALTKRLFKAKTREEMKPKPL